MAKFSYYSLQSKEPNQQNARRWHVKGGSVIESGKCPSRF